MNIACSSCRNGFRNSLLLKYKKWADFLVSAREMKRQAVHPGTGIPAMPYRQGQKETGCRVSTAAIMPAKRTLFITGTHRDVGKTHGYHLYPAITGGGSRIWETRSFTLTAKTATASRGTRDPWHSDVKNRAIEAKTCRRSQPRIRLCPL